MALYAFAVSIHFIGTKGPDIFMHDNVLVHEEVSLGHGLTRLYWTPPFGINWTVDCTLNLFIQHVSDLENLVPD